MEALLAIDDNFRFHSLHCCDLGFLLFVVSHNLVLLPLVDFGTHSMHYCFLWLSFLFCYFSPANPKKQQLLIMQILSTTDYSIFKSIEANRDILPGHVSNLVDKIQKRNLLDVNPMLLTSDLFIIDGQHRLEAARLLGVPIYYVISDRLTTQDISILNTSKKLWKLTDYLNFYMISGKEEYKKLSKFLNQNPEIPLTTAIGMLSDDSKPLPSFKEGNFWVTTLNEATEIAAATKKVSTI